jgi:hypothetical protein
VIYAQSAMLAIHPAALMTKMPNYIATTRDLRIDFCRGIALYMILVVTLSVTRSAGSHFKTSVFPTPPKHSFSYPGCPAGLCIFASSGGAVGHA